MQGQCIDLALHALPRPLYSMHYRLDLFHNIFWICKLPLCSNGTLKETKDTSNQNKTIVSVTKFGTILLLWQKY